MLPKKKCKHCNDPQPKHWPYQCRQNPKTKKSIRRVSDKQAEYHIWLEQTARPFLISKLGNHCSCCKRPAQQGEKLDIEHTKGVGSNASLKKDLSNLTLMCRFPCHRAKTDGKDCPH